MVKTDKYLENKVSEKVAFSPVRAIHVNTPTFDGSIHGGSYPRQFKAAACETNWTEKDKKVSTFCFKRTCHGVTTESTTW